MPVIAGGAQQFDHSSAETRYYIGLGRTVAEALGRLTVKKPSKTAAELEAAIKLEMEDICEWPTNIAITVRPDGETWKIVITQDSPGG